MRTLLAAVSATLAVVSLAVAPASAASVRPAVAPATGGYVAVGPVRTASLVTVAAHQTTSVRVAGGTTGVPASAAVSAVQVSALAPAATGALTVYRRGATRPGTASVQFTAGKRGSGLALVPTTTTSGGYASVYNNSAGSVQLVADVVGYYVWSATGSAAKSYTPLAPSRVLNTTLGANRSVNPVLGGHGGLPSQGIGAVAVTFSEFGATRSGLLTAGAYSESGVPQQVLNWPGGGVRVGGFAVLPTDTDGQVTLANLSAASAHVTMDVVGYYRIGAPSAAGMINTVPTAEIARAQYGANSAHTVKVAGFAGVPLHGASAVVVSVLAGSTRSSGSILTSDGGGPTAVGVQYASGVRATNTALVPLSPGGTIQLRNNASGDVNVVVDVVGWVLAGDLDVPAISTSRYLDDLTISNAHNGSVMSAHGAADAAENPRLVLLDAGAQSYRNRLSVAHPGVAIALTNPTVRITYPQLVLAVQAYVDALADHLPAERNVTVAVGTNNSGNFTDSSDPHNPIYPASTRGTDWANQVIEKVDAPAGITVVGANDIENGNPNIDGFDNSAARALQWESAYLAAHPAHSDATPDLIYNGSANGCPSTFRSGSTSTQCADGWTLQQFVQLTRNGTRIGILPQIYYPYMAIQWANINRVSGTTLTFVGSLTQPTAAGSLLPAQGWAALDNALSTLVTAPSIPSAVELVPGSAADQRLEHAKAVA